MSVDDQGMRIAVGNLGGELITVLRRGGLNQQADALERGLTSAGEAVHTQPRTKPQPPGAGDQVATIHLPDALDAARSGPARHIGEHLAKTVNTLRWTQTAAYVAAPPHPGFLDGYAHAALLGPRAAAPLLEDPTGSVALGVLLLGPRNDYPHHLHPADEVYIPLTRARWSPGLAEPHQSQTPGWVVHHRPGQAHGMRTGNASLLAIYLWTGVIHTPARFCR